MRAHIIGTGSSLPKKILTNDDLSKIVDTSDEWISSRTGIKERHIVSEDETNVTLATDAALKALDNSGVSAEELDLLILATCTPDTLVPNTACLVQANIGAKNAQAFDISAACSGFIFALNLADLYIQAGMCKKALIIGSEVLSRIVDWNDRSTCVIFADGAGAAVVEASETGMISSSLGSDGTKGAAIYVKNRENHNPFVPEAKPMDHLYMDGGEVFKFAVRKVPQSITETLDKAGVSPADVDHFILHQANLRINESIAKRLKISMDKLYVNLDHCGNTSAASVPILLDEINRKGLLKSGDNVIMSGFGSGLTWGTVFMKW